MGQPTEGVSFSRQRYLMYQGGGPTDGTTGADQVVGTDFTTPVQIVTPVPPAIAPFFIEPFLGQAVGTPPIDNFARLLFSAVRFGTAAGGDWTGTLRFKRGANGEEFAPTELTDVLIPQDQVPAGGLFIAARLPMDFMRDATGATAADTLRCRFEVSPDNIVVNQVAYVVLGVPIIGQAQNTNPIGGRGQAVSPSVQG